MADYAPPTGPPPPRVPEGWKAVFNDQYKEWYTSLSFSSLYNLLVNTHTNSPLGSTSTSTPNNQHGRNPPFPLFVPTKTHLPAVLLHSTRAQAATIFQMRSAAPSNPTIHTNKETRRTKSWPAACKPKKTPDGTAVKLRATIKVVVVLQTQQVSRAAIRAHPRLQVPAGALVRTEASSPS